MRPAETTYVCWSRGRQRKENERNQRRRKNLRNGIETVLVFGSRVSEADAKLPSSSKATACAEKTAKENARVFAE